MLRTFDPTLVLHAKTEEEVLNCVGEMYIYGLGIIKEHLKELAGDDECLHLNEKRIRRAVDEYHLKMLGALFAASTKLRDVCKKSASAVQRKLSDEYALNLQKLGEELSKEEFTLERVQELLKRWERGIPLAHVIHAESA